MTAPCNLTPAGDAECSCPIFWGILQLFGDGARCSLSDDLVNSASYDPAPDVLPTPSPTPSPAPWSCYELDTPAVRIQYFSAAVSVAMEKDCVDSLDRDR